jgi:hypothetical protein
MLQIPFVEPDERGHGVFYIVGVYNAQSRAHAEESQLGATRDCILFTTSDRRLQVSYLAGVKTGIFHPVAVASTSMTLFRC